MEVLAHSFGITVRVPGYQPARADVIDVIQLAANMARHQFRSGFISPRQPDPNP